MANKAEKLSPRIFIDEMDAINTKAQKAAIDLLSQQGDNRYIVVMDREDEYVEYYTDDKAISLSVFGVGLNEDNNLCIVATVDNQGYGCSEDDFEQDWVETSDLDIPNYANLYRFVADNIDKATTKKEADRLTKNTGMEMITASMTAKIFSNVVLLWLNLTERLDSLMKMEKKLCLVNMMMLRISGKDLQVLKLKVYGDLSTKMVKSQYHANTRWYMIFRRIS